MKISKSNQFDRTDNTSAGFTLIELLVSISIMGIVSALVGTGINFMVSSNQRLAAAQSRRVEVSQALDVISYDVRRAENVNGIQNTPPSTTIGNAITASNSNEGAFNPSLTSSSFDSSYTPVLFLNISTVCDNNIILRERVIYSTKEKGNDAGRVGPNILYRYGRIADKDDQIACSDLPVNVPIVDNITPLTPTTLTPTCQSPAASITAPFTPVAFAPTAPSDPATRISKGFYTCVSNNQVSIALFAALSNSSLIYGDNRTITSGTMVSIATGRGGNNPTPTAIENCTVPDLLTTPTSPSDANTKILTESLPYKGLSASGIPITTGGSTVISQTPSALSLIPCKTGLVTYTY